MRRWHSFILILSIHLRPASSITCFNPDGTSDSRDDFKPCYSLEDGASMCCALSDECLWNGLCKVSAAEGGTENPTYWRDMCSERDWPKVGCLNKCTNDENGGVFDGNTLMAPCDGTDYSEKWCCGNDTSCCGSGNEIHMPTNIYSVESKSSIITSSSSTATTISSTSTSTSASESTSTSPTSNSQPSSEQEQNSDSGLSTGAKAGIGVGVGVGGLAIIALLVFFFLRRRRRQRENSPATAAVPATDTGMLAGRPEPQKPQLAHAQEKPADSMHELPGEPAGPRY